MIPKSICCAPSSTFAESIAATAQENLITILIVTRMRTLPGEVLGRLDGLYNMLCITCKFRPAFSKQFYGILNEIDENDLELIRAKLILAPYDA